MLEPQRFLVTGRPRTLAAGRAVDITDADHPAAGPLGAAVEVVGTIARLTRWFISRRLSGTTVEVRERPDDSLVFVVRRGGYLFRGRVEVVDAQGEPVGWFKRRRLGWSGGFRVFDRDGRPFAEVRGNLLNSDYRILTPDGAVELGRVAKAKADAYTVEVNDDLAEQPLAKMLVLAAALATDLIFAPESRPA